MLSQGPGGQGWTPKSWNKFKPPQNVLDAEKGIKEMTMTPGFLKQQATEHIKNKLDFFRTIINHSGDVPDGVWNTLTASEKLKWNRSGSADRARNMRRAKEEFKAWSWFEATKECQEFMDGKNREQVMEFIKWLKGESRHNENKRKTPWGKKPLVGQSIITFLEDIVISRIDFEVKVGRLVHLDSPPDSIDKAWMYYKYIVCGLKNPAEYHLDEFAIYNNLLKIKDYDVSLDPKQPDIIPVAAPGHEKTLEERRDIEGGAAYLGGRPAAASSGVPDSADQRNSMAFVPEMTATEERKYDFESATARGGGPLTPAAVPGTGEGFVPPTREDDIARTEIKELTTTEEEVKADRKDEPVRRSEPMDELVKQQGETNKLLADLVKSIQEGKACSWPE